MEGKDMTRDDITRMAQEVGFVAYGEDAGEYRIPTPAFHNRLERFAALVAAAEREACAKACERRGMVKGGEVFAARIRARGQA
jgi:hypothetical protein